MIYHIYIYQNHQYNQSLKEIFDKLETQAKIETWNESILKVSISLLSEDELMDMKMIHASITDDFNIDSTIVYVSETTLTFLPEDIIINRLPVLNQRVYDINELLIELSKEREIKNQIKRNCVDLLGQDYVNTITTVAQSNMNFSIAAKKLFLHRNSLNYRIDKIRQSTNIDIKKFNGLRALISILDH